jgi:DNA-directed RNA polymerase I, II, and III subunit RPABC2/DNA-directed RNA polymerase subunit K
VAPEATSAATTNRQKESNVKRVEEETMSKGSKKKGKKEDKKKKAKLSDEEKIRRLGHIPGVGPKTGEKLVSAGFDSLKKISDADKDKLAESVSGLSPTKSETVIKEAGSVLKAVEAGQIDLSRKSKSKRRKPPEPDPDIHELPSIEAVEKAEERTKLATGYEEDNKAIGVPVGPRWLTKFEKARIIGARALQISMGAPVLIDTATAPKGRFGFAEAELKAGMLPMTVRRTIPSGESFDIPLTNLLKHTRLD